MNCHKGQSHLASIQERSDVSETSHQSFKIRDLPFRTKTRNDLFVQIGENIQNSVHKKPVEIHFLSLFKIGMYTLKITSE